MIRATPYKIIRPKSLKLAAAATLPSLLVLAGWRFGLFPDIASFYGPIVSTVFVGALAFLCPASMIVIVKRRRKPDEGLMILGMDPLALDLCRRAAAEGMVGYGEETIDCGRWAARSREAGNPRDFRCRRSTDRG